jgi:hypothetical protein
MLYVLACLAKRGLTVALADWELSGSDHRGLFERLFPDMPKLLYIRCDRPLVHEVDRLKREKRDKGIDFFGYDSIGFGCDGAPESAEAALKYLGSIREINAGALLNAHITKGENNDQRPFGSAYWHNGARCTWFLKRDESEASNVMRVGLYNRKNNLNHLHPAAAIAITFGERIQIQSADPSDSPDLAAKLTIRQRLYSLLRRGPMTVEALAEELQERSDSVSRTLRRYPQTFTQLEGGQIALLQKS